MSGRGLIPLLLLVFWLVLPAQAVERTVMERVAEASLRDARRKGLATDAVRIAAGTIRDLWPRERGGRVILCRTEELGLKPWQLFLIRGRCPPGPRLLLPALRDAVALEGHLIGFADDGEDREAGKLQIHELPVQAADPAELEQQLVQAILSETAAHPEVDTARLMAKLYRESAGLDGLRLQSSLEQSDGNSILHLRGPDLGAGPWSALVQWNTNLRPRVLLFWQELGGAEDSWPCFHDPLSGGLIVRTSSRKLAGRFAPEETPNPLAALYQEFRSEDGILRPAGGLAAGGEYEMRRLLERAGTQIGTRGEWELESANERLEMSHFHLDLRFRFRSTGGEARARLGLIYDLTAGSLSRLN